MSPIESTLLVDQELEEVFTFLNEAESHLKFIPRMIQLRQSSPGVFGQIGTTLSGTLNYFGIRIPVEYEIIDVKPGRELAMKGRMGTIHFKDGYRLRKHGPQTEIRFWLDLLPTGWKRLLSPFAGLVAKIHAWETLRNLKRELRKKEMALSSLRSSSR